MATAIHRTRNGDRARHRSLEQLLSRQGAILESRKRTLRGDLPDEMSGVVDVEERSLDAEGQGVAFSVLELTSRAVQGIETALRHLEAGRLGTSVDCGCRISSARLRALPFAARCLACQDKHDIAAQVVDGWREAAASTRIGSVSQA